MILAETVSIDGNLLLLLLAVFLATVALWCFLAIRGFFWAKQAGRGSQRALVWWVVSCVAIVLPLSPSPLVLVPLVLVGLQVRTYRRAKAEGPAAEGNLV